MEREKHHKPPPLDAAVLQMLALRYVERFATSESKLARYLGRKLDERGWAGDSPADIAGIVGRLAALGYVDDRGFGEARARGLERRGYGARRVGQDLRAAGIAQDVRDDIIGGIDARAAAITYARRRRFGPFAALPVPDDVRQRHLAAMLRAGHDFGLAVEILAAEDESALYGA